MELFDWWKCKCVSVCVYMYFCVEILVGKRRKKSVLEFLGKI